MELWPASSFHECLGISSLDGEAGTKGGYYRIQQPGKSFGKHHRPKGSIHQPLPGSARRYTISRLSFSVIPSEKNAPDQKFLYTYPRQKECQLDSLLTILSIFPNRLLGQDSVRSVRSFSRYEYYLLEQALANNNWIEPVSKEDSIEVLKPLIIPGKGKPVRVYPWNITLLRNTLVLHEKKHAEIKNDTLYVEGNPVQHCYFTKDYYWVGANNSINLSDSRLFGFVPKDHIIGRASLIWFSKEKETGLFNGYRWNRMWKGVE